MREVGFYFGTKSNRIKIYYALKSHVPPNFENNPNPKVRMATPPSVHDLDRVRERMALSGLEDVDPFEIYINPTNPVI